MSATDVANIASDVLNCMGTNPVPPWTTRRLPSNQPPSTSSAMPAIAAIANRAVRGTSRTLSRRIPSHPSRMPHAAPQRHPAATTRPTAPDSSPRNGPTARNNASAASAAPAVAAVAKRRRHGANAAAAMPALPIAASAIAFAPSSPPRPDHAAQPATARSATTASNCAPERPRTRAPHASAHASAKPAAIRVGPWIEESPSNATATMTAAAAAATSALRHASAAAAAALEVLRRRRPR